MKELVELKSILDTLYKIQKAYEYESKINSGPYKAPEQIREWTFERQSVGYLRRNVSTSRHFRGEIIIY